MFSDIEGSYHPRAEASFDFKCPGCGEEVYEGEDIYKVDDEWICEDCESEA